MTTQNLNKEFTKLNKAYIALDKQLDTATENETLVLSERMQAIQDKMSDISNQLETL
jgi:predicted  nucleic acid-binding Zn-ribbon protein